MAQDRFGDYRACLPADEGVIVISVDHMVTDYETEYGTDPEHPDFAVDVPYRRPLRYHCQLVGATNAELGQDDTFTYPGELESLVRRTNRWLGQTFEKRQRDCKPNGPGGCCNFEATESAT